MLLFFYLFLPQENSARNILRGIHIARILNTPSIETINFAQFSTFTWIWRRFNFSKHKSFVGSVTFCFYLIPKALAYLHNSMVLYKSLFFTLTFIHIPHNESAFAYNMMIFSYINKNAFFSKKNLNFSFQKNMYVVLKNIIEDSVDITVVVRR